MKKLFHHVRIVCLPEFFSVSRRKSTSPRTNVFRLATMWPTPVRCSRSSRRHLPDMHRSTSVTTVATALAISSARAIMTNLTASCNMPTVWAKLTPKGHEVLEKIRVIREEMGRDGELTQLGAEQHKGIAKHV